MIKDKNRKSFINEIIFFFKKKVKLIIALVIAILLIFFLFQYYFYYQEKKILKTSIKYNQAKNDLDSESFINSMELIAQEHGIYRILASLELINKEIAKDKYTIAYNKYFLLLNNKELNNIYKSIVALHGAYNLIDYIESNKITDLLMCVDQSLESFKGYNNESLFLLAIKDRDIEKRNKISNEILSNHNISSNIKERVRKLNEFEKYK